MTNHANCILGLGSNQGNRLLNLRRAFSLLKQEADLQIKAISPLYLSDALLPPNAPTAWQLPYLNCALRIHTTLSPEQLLQSIKKIEYKLGRNLHAPRFSPRIIDIDILAYGQVVLHTASLTLPHAELLNRPFALWPLADLTPLWLYPVDGRNQGKTAAQLAEQWPSRFTDHAPFRCQQIAQRLTGPQLMGIVNLTPDSFSDGNQYQTNTAFGEQIEALVKAGAEIIDIGAESTSPRAQPISEQEEWQRLMHYLPQLGEIKQKCLLQPAISLDTRRAAIAKRAFAYGIDWINDVTGLDDPVMRKLVVRENLPCIVVHHKSVPERRTDVLVRSHDPTSVVYQWAEQRLNELIALGIRQENIIFDPGIGFGKMAEQSWLLLRNIAAFKQLGVSLLVGHSRKTFLDTLTHLPYAQRDIETAAICQYLANHSIDFIRVHNIEMASRVLKVQSLLTNIN